MPSPNPRSRQRRKPQPPEPADGPGCPYCGEEGDCPHALLAMDITGRDLLGGALYDLAVSCQLDLQEMRDTWEEGGLNPDELPDPFERISHAMDALPSRCVSLSVDGQPGLSGGGEIYYTDTPHLIPHLEDLFRCAYWEGLL